MRKVQISLFSFWLLFAASYPAVPQQGVEVYHKRVPKETFTIAYVIPGGTADYSKEKAGIERMALEWSIKGGIQGQTPRELSREMDSLGMVMEVNASLDFSTVELTGVKKYWERSFFIFTSLLRRPSLDEVVLGDIKEYMSLESAYDQQDSENKLFRLSMQQIFEGTDYVKNPDGNISSIKGLTADDLRNHLRNVVTRKRGFLTIVGDFDQTELEKITLGWKDMPASNPFVYKDLQSISPEKNAMHQANISTNYLRGMVLSPKLTSKEGLSMLLGVQVLNHRIFNLIRGVHGLSYNPEAFYVGAALRQPYAAIKVDTQDPNQVMKHLNAIIDSLQRDGISEEELAERRSSYLTQYYLSEQTTSDQCNSLYMAVLMGDTDLHFRFAEKLNAVTREEVEQTLNKYLSNIYWTYLGDTDIFNGF